MRIKTEKGLAAQQVLFLSLRFDHLSPDYLGMHTNLIAACPSLLTTISGKKGIHTKSIPNSVKKLWAMATSLTGCLSAPASIAYVFTRPSPRMTLGIALTTRIWECLGRRVIVTIEERGFSRVPF